jgi:hypothetical protein
VTESRSKTLFAIALAAWLACGLLACGGGSTTTGTGGSATTADLPAQKASPLVSSAAALPRKRLQNDRDDDDEAGEEIGFDPNDSDVDRDNDRARLWNYYDKDDAPMRAFGHPASIAQRNELVGFAKRYLAAAAGEDGVAACSMLTSTVAKSVPQDFGRGSAGPAYLRSASTCPEVLTALFTHLHTQLSTPVQLMGVRVKGREAHVLVGSSRFPASYLELRREAGRWVGLAMLAYPLP